MKMIRLQDYKVGYTSIFYTDFVDFQIASTALKYEAPLFQEFRTHA